MSESGVAWLQPKTREFTLTVGKESATFDSETSLQNILDLLLSSGCVIKEPAKSSEKTEWEELGMSYSDWFRRHVSDI